MQSGNELKTDCIMKRIYLLGLAAFISLTAFSSCIFEAPGDEFYRTLWISEEVPLGPFEVDELTLEFLCENGISLKTDNSTIISYGTYDSNEQTAIFHDLTMDMQGLTITFVDAQLSGKTLFLRWRVENSVYPFTTAMHRKVTE
jgi:hypothetical protein